MDIDLKLVRQLIDDQFPQWSDLPINSVQRSGWDNRTFRLGNNLLIRMPSAESYAPQVSKEQQWLPFLERRLTTQIPRPVALGKPGRSYRWSWSVYKWIEGEDVEPTRYTDSLGLAKSIAQFINELHCVDASTGPVAGSHSHFRGGSLREYDKDTRAYVHLLADDIAAESALSVWTNAIDTNWAASPVWVHGDLEASNMLVSNGQLVAVIDFGNCAVGDPACDLVMAWTFFNDNARKEFRSNLSVDNGAWERGKAWALWKALFRMSESVDKCDENFSAAKQIVEKIIGAYY